MDNCTHLFCDQIHTIRDVEAIMTQNIGRTPWTGIRRGLARSCPHCGRGHLFDGYLKVRPICEICGGANSDYRADDGPAYFTILIVGHLLITPVAAFPVIWTWDPWYTAAVAVPLTAVAALGLLPFIKGAFIGLQWAIQAAGPAGSAP
jgi:uncharacterized protein (DUF983 family)